MAGAVLDDHRWHGKRAIPPLLAAGMNFQFSHWLRGTMPELLWIAVLHQALGYRDGIESGRSLAETAQHVVGEQAPLPPFSLARSYAALDADQKASLRARLALVPAASDAVGALRPLFGLYPDYPLSFLGEVTLSEDEWPGAVEFIASLLNDLSDRTSPQAALAQGTAIYIAATTGRLIFTQQAPPPNLEALLSYPKTEESRAVASQVRAAMGALIGMATDPSMSQPAADWPATFWEQGLGLEDCR